MRVDVKVECLMCKDYETNSIDGIGGSVHDRHHDRTSPEG